MTTIAYLYGPEYGARRNGIFERATELGVKVCSFQADYLKVDIHNALALAHPDVCIVESDYVFANKLTRKDFPVPVVVCDLEKPQSDAGFTGIAYDREVVSRKATEALFNLQLSNYGFAGYHRPNEWSSRRESYFRQAVKREGLSAQVFSPRRRLRLSDYMRQLEQWLVDLPKPCGIFAVNDEIGDYILTAANRLGITVPDELAVVGIDNDVDRCENTRPPLASVPQDGGRSGRLAVDFALKLLQNPSVRHPPITYGAGVLVARGSLRRFRQYDSAVTKAVDFIRTHATDPELDISAVARAIGLPLSTARIRFEKFTGHSIFEEIENQRFQIACSLLRERKRKICNLHEACGYGCARTLRNVFLKHTGETPSKWRSQHS